ncbi:MAG: DMT family transporter [Bacillota bacterium]
MKKGYIAIFIAVIAWGLSFLNSKIALKALQPMTLCFLRFSIALIILSTIAIITKRDLKIKRKDLKYFILAGGVGITVYFYFENNGVKYIRPSAASLILAGLPIATMIGESIRKHKKMTKRMIISGIISLIGVAIIISKDLSLNSMFKSSALKGYIMMFFAIISWVIYSLSTEQLFDKYNQFKIVYYQFVFGTAFAFPFIFVENNHLDLVNQETIINVFMLGIFASTIGFFSYNYAMKKLGISKSSLFINFIPLVTLIFSYFYYGELLHFRQIFGGLLIIAAVINSNNNEEVVKSSKQKIIGD